MQNIYRGGGVMEKDIYKMKLHEQIKTSNNLFITRVPGGWLYASPCGEDVYQESFVPFHNEFMSEVKQ